MRTAISKKIRFEVFKRDNFKCRYCAAKPPLAPLEIDHILPVSKGGKNNIENLVTACFDCNRGKSNILLNNKNEAIEDAVNRLKLAKKQHREFLKLIEDEENVINELIDKVEDIFNHHFKFYFSPKFRISVKGFLKHLSLSELIEAMERACSKMHNEEKCLKYFCGICWNKINGI